MARQRPELWQRALLLRQIQKAKPLKAPEKEVFVNTLRAVLGLSPIELPGSAEPYEPAPVWDIWLSS